MPTTVAFPWPKDPADIAWYWLRFAEPLSSIVSATATLQPAQPFPLTIGWDTPGDTIMGAPLAVTARMINTDPLKAGVLLTGGIPGSTYAIRVGVVTQSGSTLYRSAILQVAGL
jgi:hypothetical protein